MLLPDSKRNGFYEIGTITNGPNGENIVNFNCLSAIHKGVATTCDKLWVVSSYASSLNNLQSVYCFSGFTIPGITDLVLQKSTIFIENLNNGATYDTTFDLTTQPPATDIGLLPPLPAGTYRIWLQEEYVSIATGQKTIYNGCKMDLIIHDAQTLSQLFQIDNPNSNLCNKEVCIKRSLLITDPRNISVDFGDNTEIIPFRGSLHPGPGCPDFLFEAVICHQYLTSGFKSINVIYEGYNQCSLTANLSIYAGDVSLTTTTPKITNCTGKVENIVISTNPSVLPSGTTVQWTPTQGLSNPNILNPQVTIPQTSVTYTVTVTLPNGCSSTASVIAYPTPCCPSQPGAQEYFGTPANPFDLATLPPSALVNKSNPIILNGHFTINAQNFSSNNSVIFQNCSNVLLAPGATITVPNGKKLTIDDSHFKACLNQLWKGITLTNSASEIEVRNNSILQQADTAIRSQNGAKLSISQSTFDNNYISVLIENGGDFYNGTITQTKFLCTANSLLPPRAGLKPTSGVQLINTNGMTIGLSSNVAADRNEFDNLNNGINAVNSSVTVYANKFSNIRVWDAPNQQQAHHGAGVFANTASSFGCILLPLFGCNQGTVLVRTTFPKPSNTTPPTFENCDRGIELWNVNAEVFYNPMRHVRDGIIYTRAARKVAQIHNNYIGFAERGITASGNFVSTGTIRNNEVDLLQPPLVTPNLNWLTVLFEANPPVQYLNSYGIHIGMNRDLFTSSYRVHNNTLRNGRYGIHLLNTGARCFVYNNTISLTDNQANLGHYAGVYAENGNGSSVYQNQVTGNSTEHIVPWVNFLGARLFTTQVLSAHRKSGYLLNGSRNFLLSCNGANNIGYATHFIGNCETAPDRIRENNHGNSQYGLVLERSLGNYGYIGRFVGTPSYVNNNNFNGSYSGSFQTYNWTTNDVNAPNFVPTFFYRNNSAQTPFPNGNSAGINQLNIIPQPAFTSNGFNQCYSSGSGGEGIGGGRETVALNLEELIASGAVAFDEYNTVSRWKEEKYLFDKTDLALNKLLAQEEISGEDSALIENTVVEEFYSEKKQTFLGKLKAVEDAGAKLNDETFENHPELVENLLDVMENKLGELPDNTEQHEQNLRLVYGWLNRWAREGDTAFTQQDWQAIGELAISCPFEAGTAVYEARTLLSMKQPGLYIDDQLIKANTLKKKWTGVAMICITMMLHYLKIWLN